MKNRFCFIDYEDPRDADEAIRDMDGRDFDGEKYALFTLQTSIYRLFLSVPLSKNWFLLLLVRIIVERPKGREARGRGFRPERSDYRIRIENVPPRVHWSELKVLFRFHRQNNDITFMIFLRNLSFFSQIYLRFCWF